MVELFLDYMALDFIQVGQFLADLERLGQQAKIPDLFITFKPVGRRYQATDFFFDNIAGIGIS
jgi:hypothetical protein